MTAAIGMRVTALHAGEPCGDLAAHFALGPDSDLLVIVDGLGHGPEAALAADRSREILARDPARGLADQFAALDEGLVATRGAAVGLARRDGRRLRYGGVGNTRALRWRRSTMSRSSSQYGIVGGGLPGRLETIEIDLAPDDWFLMFTDGIDEMLHLDVELPEWRGDPALLCDHVLGRWRDARDDAGILALRLGNGP